MNDAPAKAPVFTIITVTKDHLKGLKATQSSLMAQDFKDFEWIIIDGQSTDGTQDHMKSVTDSHIKIIKISEPDSGLYDAMNKGIKRAKGEYLLFLNAGDTLPDPQTLERLTKATAKQPDFIYGDALENIHNKSGKTNMQYKHAAIAKDVAWGMFTHHQSMLYRRTIIRGAKMRYRQIYSIAGDYEFTVRFLKISKKALYIPMPICVFEGGGISQTNAFEGRRQQYIIRETLNMVSLPQNLLIFLLQSVSWTLRTRAPFIYTTLKALKGSPTHTQKSKRL